MEGVILCGRSLVIESDSVNVVKWIQKPETTPRRFRRYVLFMENLKASLNSWSIIHTLREANELADGLAKEGIHGPTDFVQTIT